MSIWEEKRNKIDMKRIFIFFISFFSLVCANAIPEVKVYSNGDYGLDFDGCQLNKKSDAMTIMKEARVDGDGNLYFLLPRNTYGVTLSDGTVIPKESDAIIKFDHTGKVAWAKVYDAGARQFEIFDGYLYLPTYNCFWNNYYCDSLYCNILCKYRESVFHILSQFDLRYDSRESARL